MKRPQANRARHITPRSDGNYATRCGDTLEWSKLVFKFVRERRLRVLQRHYRNRELIGTVREKIAQQARAAFTTKAVFEDVAYLKHAN